MSDEAPTHESLPPATDQTSHSVDATIETTTIGGGAEPCCHNNNNVVVVEASGPPSDTDREKSLEYADELMERGSIASKEQDYAEATDCFSRALEIRVAHYGELAPECVRAYYKYGCALLYKAQEEADPLGSGAVPKKEVTSENDSEKEGSVKSSVIGETSGSGNTKEGSSTHQESSKDGSSGEDQEEGDQESDAEDLAGADEDESDLDLAWKMLDVARAIVEKQSDDTIEKVDILSALAEVALEREDVETSLSDYLKALSILERITEPDSRHIAELNFRICLCLEVGSKAQEAVPYCQKAISVCKSRLQRLMNEVTTNSCESTTSVDPKPDLTVQQSSSTTQSMGPVSDKEKEIETLTSLSIELEKKLEDLQQFVSNPKSILSDIMGMVAAKAKVVENVSSVAMSSSRIGASNSGGGFESPTVSTAHTNGAAGVTHLGVVGRGVKRVLMNAVSSESNAAKKLATDPSADNGGNDAS